MREIVLDVETTGLDVKDGHRIVEIGCVELINKIETGVERHVFIDPQRPIERESTKIHGITNAMLRGKPTFREIADKFLDFLGDAPIIAHNAPFDFGFIDAELVRTGKRKLDRNRMIDTVELAKRKYPGSPFTLDALCRHYKISLDSRKKHGALIDARLLARVYIELSGGNQTAFAFNTPGAFTAANDVGVQPRPTPLPPRLTAEEIKAHEEFVKTLDGEPIWNMYRQSERKVA